MDVQASIFVFLKDYQSPITSFIKRAIRVIPSQQAPPRRMGLPLFFTRSIKLLFRPIAAMAKTIQNLDRVFRGGEKVHSQAPVNGQGGHNRG